MRELTTDDFEARLASFSSTRFKALRASQKQVLTAYAADHRDTADLAIEMPTGEGKTLVALLIADYALENGRSVAYLTGTRQLAERVVKEAENLGLDVARFARKDYGGAKLSRYHEAEVVGVMNYWVYFNGKPVPEPADVVILDDAHLAEQPLSGIQTLRIPTKKGPALDLYRTICNLVLAHADSYPNLLAMAEGTSLPGTPPELLSFIDWHAIVSKAEIAIADSDFAESKDGKYAWRKVRDHLAQVGVLIGPSAIEIRPYHPPTVLNRWYSEADQRIYLSATLGTMDDLQRRIGGREVTRLVTSGAVSTGSTGARRFLLNPSSDAPFSTDVLNWALAQCVQADNRTAWLCASHDEAEELEGILNTRGLTTFRLKSGDDTPFDAWASAPHGHLITAGRYDGLDLAGDLCKLVVITTVPQASSEFERFVVAYLGDASFMRHRVGQRITQALGRANREPSDHSLYLGLDPRFAQILADRMVKQTITPTMEPIVNAALETYDTGWDGTNAAAASFWHPPAPTAAATTSSDPSPTRRARPGRKAKGSSLVSSASHEVDSVANLWTSDHTGAATSAFNASELLRAAGEVEHAAFWRYVEAHAHFTGGTSADLEASRKALADAIKDGPRTTWFQRLRRAAAALEGRSSGQLPVSDGDRLFLTWDDWRRESAGKKLGKQLGTGRAMLNGSHDQQCDGLLMLARLCGVDAARPPKAEQSATDCRWSWSTTRKSERRVWEVKTAPEGNPGPLVRDDVNQLLGQIQVETGRFANTRVYGCLLTPATAANSDAKEAARDRITLINHDAAMKLYDVLSDRITQYDDLCGGGSAESRGEARTQVETRLPEGRWLSKLLKPSQGNIVRAADVADLFSA